MLREDYGKQLENKSLEMKLAWTLVINEVSENSWESVNVWKVELEGLLIDKG